MSDVVGTGKAQSKPKAKPVKLLDASKLDGRHHVHISMSGTHFIVQWPFQFAALCDHLDGDRIPGKLEVVTSRSVFKKTSALSLENARQTLDALLPYKQQKIIKLTRDEQFAHWFEGEFAAAASAQDAYTILQRPRDGIKLDHPEMKIPLKWWEVTGYECLNITTRGGKGALLCDRTGLGKTFTATAHLVTTKHKAVVVCPASLRLNWEKKIKMLSHLTTYVMGSKDGKKYQPDMFKADVIIVSFHMLKKFAAWPLAHAIQMQGRVLLVDEAHLIRNPDAGRTSDVQFLAKHARHTIPITATPLVNRVRELHSLLTITRRHWTQMGLLEFIREYEHPDGEKEIAERLKGIMIRRHGEEVWEDMPASEVGEIWLKLTNQDDYIAAERDFIAWLMARGASLDELDRAERGHALVKMNKLRELAAVGKIADAGKIIENTLECGEQTIVFCAFNEPLVKLAQMFSTTTGTTIGGKQWRGSATIIGSVPEHQRQRIINDFQEGKIGLLCVGVQAGGLGIDLPAACIGYFLDLPWTPADFEQAMGRMLRLGQTRACQFIKLLAENTIDSKMEEFLHRKANTFRNAIGDERAVARISSQPAEQLSQTRAVQALISAYLREMVA